MVKGGSSYPDTFPGGHHSRDKSIALLQTFADQAVIAVQNVQSFNDTKETLERQTVTANILSVISGSPTDEQPVLEAIVQSAARLFDQCNAMINMMEGGLIHSRARAGQHLGPSEIEKARALYPMSAAPEVSISGRSIVERRIIGIVHTETPDAPGNARALG